MNYKLKSLPAKNVVYKIVHAPFNAFKWPSSIIDCIWGIRLRQPVPHIGYHPHDVQSSSSMFFMQEFSFTITNSHNYFPYGFSCLPVLQYEYVDLSDLKGTYLYNYLLDLNLIRCIHKKSIYSP